MTTAFPPPVCFIHVPKTAGTSMATVLSRFFPPEHVSRARLLYDLTTDPDEEHRRLWHGHFGLGDALQFVPESTRFVTTLRDPVRRVLSLYHYWHSVDLRWYKGTSATDPNYEGVMLAIQSSDIGEFLATDNPSILREISDTQTRYLCGSLYDEGQVSAEKAIREVVDRRILVARQAHFEADVTFILHELFGASLEAGDIVHLNRQTYQAGLTGSQHQRIIDLNPNDVELLTWASESIW